MKHKKTLSAILSLVMVLLFATPALATIPAQDDCLDNVMGLVNAYVQAMDLQDIVAESTSTSFSQLVSECGARWLVPVYTIETTELARGFSSDALGETRVFTQIACTENLIPLTRTVVRDDPTRSLRFSLSTTLQFQTQPVNPPRPPLDFVRLTRVQGSTTFLTSEGRVTGGHLHFGSMNPFYAHDQVVRNRAVGASFNINTNFSRFVPAAPGSVVGATWNVEFNIRTSPMSMSIQNLTHGFL